MNDLIPDKEYNKLLKDISSLYESTRSAIVTMYWSIGKYIVVVEQKNSSRAHFGDKLIERLAEDLSAIYGKGFSMTNLRRMRSFYNTYSIQPALAELGWSHYTELIKVKDPRQRKIYEEKIIKESLSHRQLIRLMSGERNLASKDNKDKSQLKLIRGRLHTYPLIDPSRVPGSNGYIVADCGFNVWEKIIVKNIEEYEKVEYITSLKNRSSFNIKPAPVISPEQVYTYKAYIEKIVDGDTLWAVVDCGFYSYTRQKLRLRGIDTPEMNTKEGEKAKRYVTRVLSGLSSVVIKTYKSDKYDRYLSDIFYLPGEDNIKKINKEGLFLNQELLDRGLAVFV